MTRPTPLAEANRPWPSIAHTIPEPRDQRAHRRRKGSTGGRPVGLNAGRYTRRNVVERSFCQVKQWRGLATRYDEHARNHAGALNTRRAADLAPMIRRTLPSGLDPLRSR